MNPLKKLAGQTMIYGLSSIVARILNFFLVPLYTYKLQTGSYGNASELLAYIALFIVLLTFGLETGFFKFASKHKEKVAEIFSTSVIFIGLVSLVFVLLIFFFLPQLQTLTGYIPKYLFYVCLIIALDSFTAIFFTKLRYEEKAVKFVTFRIIKIFTELSCNFILFFWMPTYFASHPNSLLLNFVTPTPSYDYIIFAILISCIISLLLFVPEMLKMKFVFLKHEFKQLFAYSLPLMVAGLPGVANDLISRIFFRFFAPDSSPWENQLGIFNANVKLAVFMVLFVQMFRYAAEPFFFANADKDDNRKTYALIMKYFVTFCLFIFLFIGLYKDLFSLFLGKDFRVGIYVLPIMLIANILLGIVFNLSMWYKLSGQTQYAAGITLLGLAINLIVIILFMPQYGDRAAAWGYLLSYLAMTIYSAYLAKKHFPIPYEWKKIIFYFATAISFYLIADTFVPTCQMLRLSINTLYIIAFAFIVMKKEHIDIKQIKRIVLNK